MSVTEDGPHKELTDMSILCCCLFTKNSNILGLPQDLSWKAVNLSCRTWFYSGLQKTNNKSYLSTVTETLPVKFISPGRHSLPPEYVGRQKVLFSQAFVCPGGGGYPSSLVRGPFLGVPQPLVPGPFQRGYANQVTPRQDWGYPELNK